MTFNEPRVVAALGYDMMMVDSHLECAQSARRETPLPSLTLLLIT
ncbi:hypothetical protein SEVIR_4G281733v4 [Setaria viridis]